MKLKHLLSVLMVAISFPQAAALANTFPAEGPSGSSPGLSTSSSDVINQNQQSVTNNDTSQAATGIVQQSANYNIGQAATYDFRGIAGTRAYCPEPALLFSGSSSFGYRGASSNNLSAAFVVPLGGKAGRNCTKISTQILKEQEQHLLHTSFNNQYQQASRCASLLSSGASINAEVFPELAQICNGITVAQGGGELPPEPEAKREVPPPVVVPPPPPAVRSSY
ncbi:MAG: hypothetical protein ACFCU8_19985 [Thermosynechococcaceae cyanobacterium]